MGIGDALGAAWKAAKGTGDVIFHAMPGVALAGFATDLATAPWNDNEQYNGFLNTLQSRFATRLGDVLEPIDILGGQHDEAALKWLIPKYQRIRSYGLTRPLATLTLSADQNVGTHGGSILNPGNWRDAWNASRDISPGQAWAGAIFGGSEATPGPIGTFGGAIGRLGDADFDITDPADRQAFHAGFGQYASGIPDAWMAWTYTDPVVLGGGAIGAARQAALVKPLAGGAPGALPEAAYGGFARESYSGMERKVIGAKPLTPEQALAQPRVTRMFDNLAAMNPDTRANWLARNPTFMPNVGVQHLLTHAADADEMRMILRYTMDGSARNRSQLADNYAMAAAKVDYLKDIRIPSITTALRNDVRMTPALRKTMEDTKAYYNAELAKADQGLEFARITEHTAGTINVVPRVTVGQKLTELGPTWQTYQPSRYGTATRVLKSAGTRRPGTVDFNRPGMATEQAKRLLDRVGHGFEKDFLPIAGAGSRGMPVATKASLIAKVAEAEKGGIQADVKAALTEVERAAMHHYGKAFGADADAVERLYLETAERRTQALGPVGEERYSAALRPGARRGEGKYVDQVYDNGTGELVRTPVTTSQFTDTMPLIDVDALGRIMHRHREALKGEDAKHIVARLEGSEATAFTRGAAEEALVAFNRYWKPAQLFRLGWPMRVITDEQIRTLATVGLLTHLPVMAHSFAHSLREGRPGTALRAALTSGDRLVARHGLAQRFDTKAADLERGTIVDGIAAIDARTVALDAQITQAGQRLREAAKATEGTRLYTAAPKSAKLVATPRGVRYEMEHPGRAYGPLRAGEVHHARVGADIADNTVYLPRSYHDDPGIAALEDFAGTRRLEDLMAMTNRDLRIVLQREVGPQVKIARYKTKEELLSVYGATLARRQGHKAIYHGRGEQMSYTALTDDVVRKVDDEAFGKAADELERLRIARDTLAAHRATLTGQEAALPPWTTQMQAEWDGLLSRAVDPRRRRKEVGPAPKFAGTRSYTAASGQAIRYDDSFGGQSGQVYVDLSSAGSTMRSLAGLQDRYVNGLRLQSGEHGLLGPTTKETGNRRVAHERSYAIGWEKAVNDQIGKNPLGRKILEGRTDDEIVLWLKHSKEGREHRRQHPVRASDPRRWVEEVRLHVDHYLPDGALRRAALEGNARIGQLEKVIPEAEARPVIHGESLELATGTSKISSVIDRMVGATYQKLGTAPTDILSRHPFFTATYRAEMVRQIDALNVTKGQRVTEEQVVGMQRRAREHALTQTRHTLYDVANSSNLAHTMRFTAPFYAAWQDALTTWGRLWMEDPSRLGRVLQAWEAPSKAHITYDDEHGKTWATLPLPQFVKDAIPVLKGDMPANYLQSLIAQGDYWMVPGAGSPVTVPINSFIRHRPDLYPLLKPLIPYGAGESALDDLLPAGWKRGKSLFTKTDDYAYVAAYQRMTMEVYTERRTGKFVGDDTAMNDEAVRRTNDFFRLRMAANLVLPYSPNFRSPYQFYLDQAAAMRQQYAAYPGGKDPGGKNWEEAFLDKNGEEYFAFTAGLTKSNVGGLSPTSEGFQAYRKYATLIQENPDYGGLIAGATDDGTFNPEVYQYQRTHPIGGGDLRPQREVRSPDQAIADAETQRGWDAYRQIDTYVDQQLKNRGLRSINAKAATDLALIKRAVTDKIAAKYPAWAEAYGTFTPGKAAKTVSVMESLLGEPGFAERPGYRTLASYLAARRSMVAALSKRDSQNLQSKENDDLRVYWDAITTKLRQSDTDFADLHSRYLRNDNRLDAAG